MKIFWLIFIGLFLVCNIVCLIWLLREGKQNKKREKLQEGEYEEFLKWYKSRKK